METMNSSFMKAVRPMVHLIVGAFSCFAAILVPQPFMPTLLLGSLCAGENECSEIIYLVGALQLGIGIGAVVMAPILGGLSDSYGRKPILLLVFFTAIFPLGLLACVKTKEAVYVWFLLVLIASTFREGGLVPTLLAVVADVADENHRPALNGLTIGSLSVGYMGGTIASMVLKTVDQALWASVILQICAATYVKVFFKETNPREPVLPAIQGQSGSAMKFLLKPKLKRQISTSFRETAKTVWSSRRLMTLVLVDFFNSYGFAGLDSFLVFYLVAVFDYGTKQLAVIYLLRGAGSALGMTIAYPLLSHYCGERVVLWVGLLANGGHYFIYGLARTPWLPYVATGMEIFHSVTKPALGTMVSKGVDREAQGKIQGFMGSVRSLATILAPLTITPLAAAALGQNPPFGLAGLPFIICGSSMVLAWLISTGLPPLAPPVQSEEPTEYIQAPMPPQEHTIVPSLI